jgi:hypothetical protein
MLGWLTGRAARREKAAVAAWRKAWAAALTEPEATRASELRQSLETLGADGDDLEIELEMVDGLSALAALTARLRAGEVPVVQTGHRVVGADACHFSAPASIPDDAAQPGGRVILTDRRAIFAGSGRTAHLAWHRVADVLQMERDLLLIANDGATVHRFRFNSFTDALCATALSRHLSASPRHRTSAL